MLINPADWFRFSVWPIDRWPLD